MIRVTEKELDPMIKFMTDWNDAIIKTSLHSADFFQRRMTRMTDAFWDQAAWTTKVMGNAMTGWNSLYFENILNP